MKKYFFLTAAVFVGISLLPFSAFASDLKKPKGKDKKEYTGSTIIPGKGLPKPNTTNKPNLPSTTNPCPNDSTNSSETSECPEPAGSAVK